MTLFDDVSARAKIQLPELQIKYKNESSFMKVVGAILFFNPGFMTQYATTIGSTVYLPNRDYINSSPEDAAAILLHELVHVYDAQNKNKFVYSFLYLIPQIFFLLAIPLFFIFGWKIALLSLLFLSPLPAFFRAIDEKRGYTISIYVYNKFVQQGLQVDLNGLTQFVINQFKNSSYYYMWPFTDVNAFFSNTLIQIQAGNRPNYETALYDMIDKILLG